MNIHDKPPRSPVWMTSASCSLEDFRACVEIETTQRRYPLADEITRNVPIYDAQRLFEKVTGEQAMMDVMAEWNDIFLDGPGVIVCRKAFADATLVDQVSIVLKQIIADERKASGSKGDHFGQAGANARVWNSHEKLCMLAPELYARYSANEIFSLASRSWLGPLYQITTQVNLVYPGGAAQVPHRDYHMGFQQEDQLKQYPAHTHWLSAALTLQGAVAHCDMPIESGPTKILPYSQRYLPGYFATARAEFRSYFEDHFVQLPLGKGDAMFFNPAVFHAAGTNVTASTERLANLMQINSCYGRPIEIVDRARMTKHLYPTMLAMQRSGEISPRDMENLIAATADGYPFACNLDLDSPLSGLAPASQQDILRQALREDWTSEQLNIGIDAYMARRVSH